MEWISVKDRLPDNLDEVFVCQKYEFNSSHYYAVAFYHTGHEKWIADQGALSADNYDGGCLIYRDTDITHWAEIEPPK